MSVFMVPITNALVDLDSDQSSDDERDAIRLSAAAARSAESRRAISSSIAHRVGRRTSIFARTEAAREQDEAEDASAAAKYTVEHDDVGVDADSEPTLSDDDDVAPPARAGGVRVDDDGMMRAMRSRPMIAGRPMRLHVCRRASMGRLVSTGQRAPGGGTPLDARRAASDPLSTAVRADRLPLPAGSSCGNLTLTEWARTVPQGSTVLNGGGARVITRVARIGRILNVAAANCPVHVHLCTGFTTDETTDAVLAVARVQGAALLSRHKAREKTGQDRVVNGDVVIFVKEMQSVATLRRSVSFLMNEHLACDTGCVFVAGVRHTAFDNEEAVAFVLENMRCGSLTLYNTPPFLLERLRASAQRLSDEDAVAGAGAGAAK